MNSFNSGHTHNLNLNKKLPKIEAKSKVNTGLKKSQTEPNKKNHTEIQNEYVIKEQKTNLVNSLAEKIGLVPTTSDNQLGT